VREREREGENTRWYTTRCQGHVNGAEMMERERGRDGEVKKRGARRGLVLSLLIVLSTFTFTLTA
jgi:hypothetical protein